MYKKRKETTHVKVGEEDVHHHKYISKISTIYVNMVTRPVYKKKDVSIPPNKMKHNSPLQRNVFLPLTCRILKKETTSQFLLLFVIIDKGYKKLKSFTRET